MTNKIVLYCVNLARHWYVYTSTPGPTQELRGTIQNTPSSFIWGRLGDLPTQQATAQDQMQL